MVDPRLCFQASPRLWFWISSKNSSSSVFGFVDLGAIGCGCVFVCVGFGVGVGVGVVVIGLTIFVVVGLGVSVGFTVICEFALVLDLFVSGVARLASVSAGISFLNDILCRNPKSSSNCRCFGVFCCCVRGAEDLCAVVVFVGGFDDFVLDVGVFVVTEPFCPVDGFGIGFTVEGFVAAVGVDGLEADVGRGFTSGVVLVVVGV